MTFKRWSLLILTSLILLSSSAYEIAPLKPEECADYIKNEPDRSICYFIIALRNNDTSLCSFVGNYSFQQSGATCSGHPRYTLYCQKTITWTIDESQCIRMVNGESVYPTCPFWQGGCEYDELSYAYALTDEELRISREFGALCRTIDCLLDIAKAQNTTKETEICMVINDEMHGLSYECFMDLFYKIAPSDVESAIEICDGITQIKKKDICYTELAETIRESRSQIALEICKKASTEHCFLQIAMRVNSTRAKEICEIITNSTYKDLCYNNLAYKSGVDLESALISCDNISNAELKERCNNFLASRLDRYNTVKSEPKIAIQLCDRIILSNSTENLKDLCYYKVSELTRTSDPKLAFDVCQKIVGYRKEWCTESVFKELERTNPSLITESCKLVDKEDSYLECNPLYHTFSVVKWILVYLPRSIVSYITSQTG